MARETKKDLQDRIASLMRQNERLKKDRVEYFDRMTNAELQAERAVCERDEISKELDALKAELEALKAATAAGVPKMEPITEQPQNARRGRPVTIKPDQRQRVQDLHKAGASVRTIARETGLSVGSVQRILHGQQ